MPAIGILTLELHLEDAHSLKEKRHWVKGLKERLRAHHNVSVAEVDDHRFHNRGMVAAVTVSCSRENAAKVLESAERLAASFLGRYLASATIDWLE
jgi:uncharacterized protein YlxP (DUF503 family)